MELEEFFFDIIVSMDRDIKSKVKLNNKLSDKFSCMTGVRQGECLSPILFAMYTNGTEQDFITKGADGVDIGLLNCSFYYKLTMF